MNRLFVLSIPLIALLCFFGFTRVYHKKCKYSPFLSEIASFSYEKFEPLTVPDIKFNFRGYIFPEGVKKSKVSIAKMIENLKVSVITGKKMYVLLDSRFIEKGESYNGIKFLGIDNGEVIFEVDGKIYRKKL